jgi:hypothetical protein
MENWAYIRGHWLVDRSVYKLDDACGNKSNGERGREKGREREPYPHQISFSDPGSLTILLSNGERPVFAPEYAVRAPVEVMAEPVS